MPLKNYFKSLESGVKKVYDIAEKAREKGFDPISKVEISLAKSLAERVVGLISSKYPQINNKKIADRIKELEKEHGKLHPAICLIIAEEIAKEKFCKFKDLLEGIDAGMRVAFAYLTLGVVSSPLEGYTHFKLKKTKDNKDYFCVYYSGPIRSAGTTAGSFSLVIIDYLREKFGYAKYDPTEEEVKRTVREIYDFHERITNLQYLPKEEEIEFLARHLPVQIDGEPSEIREVSNYKDLERVETNLMRSGFCLIFAEGISQKAPKVLRMINKLKEKGFELSSWDWLEDFVKLKKSLIKKSKEEESSGVYIKDLVAGRPVFGHPSKSGAFRLRYGRARTTGYSALAVHPATMAITNNFIAVGTQLKIEKPTKAGAIQCCDSIDGPIVKLKDGSVLYIEDKKKAEKIYKDVEEIIYLGDILVPYGDFANRNYKLEPPGYVEQYWEQHYKAKTKEPLNDIYKVSLEEALKISEKLHIPLYPKYIFYWSQISKEQFKSLICWLIVSKIEDNKIIFPYSKKDKEKFALAKRALELLGVPHLVTLENVVIKGEVSKAVLINLGLKEKPPFSYLSSLNTFENVLDFINSKSEFKIKDKAGTFIGARMGRPEKAKLRKLTGSPNVLFPVGEEGGRMRSVNEALKKGFVKAEFPTFFCSVCNKETIYPICENCNSKTQKKFYCPKCMKEINEKCKEHGICNPYKEKKIDLPHYFKFALKRLSLSKYKIPELIKGVRGTSSAEHIPESLEKGILRAMFNLQVNKDGTIRYDCTELPITHFKPREIGTNIEKLKELGYTHDKDGKELTSDDQILEIKPQDILLPSCPVSPDEPADKVMFNVAKFLDNLLARFYGLDAFYNLKSEKDLVGHLVVCIAPHNAAGVVGRIIGTSKIQALVTSPYMHAAVRRDCDGDEAGFMLLLDTLLNFSRKYLHSHRGATQDAPLVLNMRIRPGEVDDMIFDLDVSKELPLEFYEKAEQGASPYSISLPQIRDRTEEGDGALYNLHYSYKTSDIGDCNLCSSYKTLATMKEKVESQMELAEKIRAVLTGDVARLIIERHFIRDIKGNLRKFSQQQFRCVNCNTKYRRPPLAGKCLRCGGRIIFTVSKGSIIKYLEPALSLAEKFEVPEYTKHSLYLVKTRIESIFGKEKDKQVELKKWF